MPARACVRTLWAEFALALMLGWRGARHAGVPDPDRHRDCEAEHQARLRIRLLELMSDWAYGMPPRTW